MSSFVIVFMPLPCCDNQEMYFNAMQAIYGEFSDDEEDIIPRAPALYLHRANYFDTLNDNQFFMRFRLTKDTVAMLLDQIEPEIRTRTRK